VKEKWSESAFSCGVLGVSEEWSEIAFSHEFTPSVYLKDNNQKTS